MFYKCIPEVYYRPGMILDSNTRNYGSSFYPEYDLAKEALDYIITASLETDLPLSLFYFLLGAARGMKTGGTLPKTLQNLNRSGVPFYYKISELVDDKSIRSVVTRTQLEEYAYRAKQTKQIFTRGNFIWEYIAERIREEEFSELPKRLKSNFLFESRESCEYYLNKWKSGERSEWLIVEAEIVSKSKTVCLDMNIWDIYMNSMTIKECSKLMRTYWESSRNQKVPEILTEGSLRLC